MRFLDETKKLKKSLLICFDLFMQSKGMVILKMRITLVNQFCGLPQQQSKFLGSSLGMAQFQLPSRKLRYNKSGMTIARTIQPSKEWHMTKLLFEDSSLYGMIIRRKY
jgi:hypothetical protein